MMMTLRKHLLDLMVDDWDSVVFKRWVARGKLSSAFESLIRTFVLVLSVCEDSSTTYLRLVSSTVVECADAAIAIVKVVVQCLAVVEGVTSIETCGWADLYATRTLQYQLQLGLQALNLLNGKLLRACRRCLGRLFWSLRFSSLLKLVIKLRDDVVDLLEVLFHLLVLVQYLWLKVLWAAALVCLSYCSRIWVALQPHCLRC